MRIEGSGGQVPGARRQQGPASYAELELACRW